MTYQEAVERIYQTNGKVFSIEFQKRTTGERRVMNCRLGVKSHLRGGELAFDPKAKNLLIVFDMAKVAYRSIPIDGITQLKVDGNWQIVK